MYKGMRVALILFTLLFCVSSFAAGPSLLRVERRFEADRTALITAGIPLVAEREGCLIALGDPRDLGGKLSAMGYSWILLDPDTEGRSYYMAGLRSGTMPGALGPCGDALWTEDNWVLLRVSGALLRPGCIPENEVFLRKLELAPLSLPSPPPAEYASLQPGAVTPKPLVQDIVTNLNGTTIMSNWDDVINSATTRYSTAPGCQTAVTAVYNKYSGLGLTPYYQSHTAGHAPNVIGVMQGRVNPEKVYIVIGHIDDLPSTGLAPGADDNASGAATATTAAQVLSPYSFANTIKFIDVTGEEFGLYGSTYYANNAHSAGEQIQAVLNADMIGWQGDTPGTENLDLNFNSASQWLGTLFTDCAVAYGTGCTVDAFLCPSLDASDHAPFWDNGFSAVCGITDNEGYCGHNGNYPYYHTSNDTKANCGTTAFFFGAVRAYIATLAHLADPLCSNPFPTPPASLNAVAAGANHVTVSWPSAGAGVTYEVYRAPGGCSGGYAAAKIGETGSTSYDDGGASGGITYAYTVKTKKTQCVSNASACAEAATTGSCTEAPSFAGLGAVANAAEATCKLNLSWSAAHAWCGGPLTYRVYRSTTAPFTPSLANRIADAVSGTTYSDSGTLTYNIAYYYIVRAVDMASAIEETNTVTLSGVATGPVSIGTWTDDAGDTGTAKLTPSAPWQTLTTGGHTGAKVYATGNYGSSTCASLTGPTMILGTGSQLTFWSKYDLESGWDKGQVEITEDGGTTWVRVPVNYPLTSTHTGDSCAMPANQNYFTGTNNTWASYTAALATWNNKTVTLRWRISSDSNTEGTGWWVDDIAITNVQVPSSCTTSGGGCNVSCTATVPASAGVAVPVSFQSTATPTNCTGAPTFSWTFGDGGTSTSQNPSHSYATAGTYNWTFAATADGVPCTKSGSILISDACTVTCTATVPTAGSVGFPVSFQSTATPVNCSGSTTFSWTFGDGGTSAQQNPSHTYSAAGAFNWSVTATAGGVSCAKSGSIVISAGCSLSCTATVPPTGSVGVPVSFQSTATPANCTGAPAFSWAFGDGGTSTQQNPSHVYTSAGTFTWTLSITVADQTCTKTGTIGIGSNCAFSCNASVQPGSGPAPLRVTFSASAATPGCSSTTVSYMWDFGDGLTSAQKNSVHEYAAAGTYSWTLTATSNGLTCTKGGTIKVTAPCALSCSATATPSSGTAPLPVAFTATATATNCTGTPSYAWAFGDGGTSTQQNPGHTYSNEGSYNWTLTVTVEGKTCSQTGTITVSAAPVCAVSCSATAAPASGAAPLDVAFTAAATATNCVGAPSYGWTFGDGGTAATQNPSHTYASTGTYTWTMTATVDSTTCSKAGTITVGEACALVCEATAPGAGRAGDPVVFSATAEATHCAGNPAFAWTFGDGGSSAEQNPNHIYSAAGSFTWTLAATVDGQTCTKTGTIAITEPCTVTCTAAANPTPDIAPWSVAFAATAAPANCAGAPAFAWTFGDGATSSEQNPSHTYASEGSYSWSVTVTVDGKTCAQTGEVTLTPGCELACEASATPAQGKVPLEVVFTGTASATHCSGAPIFAWAFGDGATSPEQSPTHIYAAVGTYSWTLTVSVDGVTCSRTGTITVTSSLPGDGNNDGVVSIGEVQQAINMFLGLLPPGNGVDCNGDGTVSIGEVQKVINAFLGLPSSC
jgi:PKD repeat protein